MFEDHFRTVPAWVIAVDGDVYTVEVDDPDGGPDDVIKYECKEHRLRHQEPDMSRNDEWVMFACEVCGLPGGSREVSARGP